MSRIGKKPIPVPQGVTCSLEERTLTVKGPKGELSLTVHPSMGVALEESKIVVTRPSESKTDKSLHGTMRSLIQNMIIGVTEGYAKKLQIIGVGYRAAVQGKKLVVTAGYANPVELDIPSGIDVDVAKNTEVNVSGIDKQAVGAFAANIRAVRKPEPYLGKGIRYADERVRRKVGKTAK